MKGNASTAKKQPPETAVTAFPKNLYTMFGCRNLRFLLDFFMATGLTPNSFGKLTDNPKSTAQTVKDQLKKDDMKVSRAARIVSAAGFELKIELREKAVTVTEPPEYTLILPERLQENLKRGILASQAELDKRLAFVKLFLSRNKISQRRLAKDLGLSAGSVETWFRSDDLLISYLFRIKEVYPVDIVFIISEKEGEGQDAGGPPSAQGGSQGQHPSRRTGWKDCASGRPPASSRSNVNTGVSKSS